MADDLTIEVTASAGQADTALAGLIKRLDEFQTRIDSITPSVTKFTERLNSIASSSKAFKQFESVKQATQIFDQFGNVISTVSAKTKPFTKAGQDARQSAHNIQLAAKSMQNTIDAASDPIKNLTLQIDIQGQKMAQLQQQYEAVARKEGTSSVQALNLQSRMLKVGETVDRLTTKLDRVKSALASVDDASKRINTTPFSMPASDFAAKYNHSSNGGVDLTPQTSEGTEAGPAPANASVEHFDTSKIQAQMDALTGNIEGKKPKVNLDTEAATAKVREIGQYIDGLTPRISMMSAEAQARFGALAAKLNTVGQQIDNQRMLYRNLASESARVAEETGEGSTAYLQLEKRMLSADSAVQRLTEKQDELKTKMLNITEASNKAGSSISNFGNKVKSAVTTITGFGNDSERAANRSTSGWAKTLSMFERMMIRIAAFKVYSAIWQGFQTGIQDMAQASSQANAAMSALATSSLYLKNSIAAALMPAIQAITPVITQAMNALAGFFNMIGMLTARIFGNATSVTVAKAAQVNYAASVAQTGSKAKDATNAVKELQKTVMGFDELNVLQKPSTPSAGDSSGAANGGMPAPAQEFTTTKIPSNITALGDSIKTELAKWAQYAQPTVIAFQNLVKSLEPLKTFAAKGLEDFYNDFLVPVGKWVLGTGLPNLLNTTSQLVKSVDWSKLNKAFDDLWKALAPFAEAIGQGLINFYDDLLVPIAKWTLGTGLPSFLEIMSNLLNNIDWGTLNTALDNVWKAVEPFAENVGNGLLWFLQNVLSPLAQWALNDVAPAALDLISNAIKTINATIDALKPVGQWLFDSFLKPIAAWTGDAFVAAIKAVSGALSNISTWITQNQGAVQTITKAVLAFFAAWEATKLLAFIEMSGGLIGALQAITAATIGATAAKIADKAETIALTALYAKDFLASIVSGTAAMIKQAAQWVILTAAKAADIIKTVAQTAATGLATAAQTALNFVLNANPIGLVITGIAALVAGIILLYNKNEWFRKGWNSAWTTIGNGFKSFINTLIAGLNGLIDGINFVVSALNKIHFDVPDWVPDIGGKSIGVNLPKAAKIPYLAEGALLTAPTLFYGAEAGDNEAVLPLNPSVFSQIAKGIQENGNSGGMSDSAVSGIYDRLDRLEAAINKLADCPVNLYADDRKIAESANRGNRIIDRRYSTISHSY